MRISFGNLLSNAHPKDLAPTVPDVFQFQLIDPHETPGRRQETKGDVSVVDKRTDDNESKECFEAPG